MDCERPVCLPKMAVSKETQLSFLLDFDPLAQKSLKFRDRKLSKLARRNGAACDRSVGLLVAETNVFVLCQGSIEYRDFPLDRRRLSTVTVFVAEGAPTVLCSMAVLTKECDVFEPVCAALVQCSDMMQMQPAD